MKIEVLVEGDPDIKPLTKIFHYTKSDELIFLESTKLIQKRLENNMKLNVNETLWFFVTYIINSLNEGKTITVITKHLRELLLPNQVMIGVPESLRRLTFTILSKDNQSELISITTPICINQYFFHELEKMA
ncbi:MAG TPA: urease subunit gamma [Nitrosopumilaceae archaeon]|nr:urease subunit gamma [Nitrosopumilaceae archaeon]